MKQYSTILDIIMAQTRITFHYKREKISLPKYARGLEYIHSKGILHRDISLTNVFIKHYDDVDVVKIADFGLVKVPDSNLTSLKSELKGSLNDPDLINVGFSNYQMCHETFALTRLCMFILTGKATVQTLNDGVINDLGERDFPKQGRAF